MSKINREFDVVISLNKDGLRNMDMYRGASDYVLNRILDSYEDNVYNDAKFIIDQCLNLYYKGNPPKDLSNIDVEAKEYIKYMYKGLLSGVYTQIPKDIINTVEGVLKC